MICIYMILLNGWCRMRMRPARLVSYAFLYTTIAKPVYHLLMLVAPMCISEHRAYRLKFPSKCTNL